MNEADSLKIHFVGINMERLIDAITNHQRDLPDAILARIKGGENSALPKKMDEKWDETIHRRTGLASLVVDSLRNDYSLGEVKLAKVIYLADAHLKLNLKGEYLREIAGPLDQRMLFHPKWGIKEIAARESIFRLSHYKYGNKTGRRFIKDRNIESAVDRARKAFPDKIDNILGLISLFQGLNTTRSEIIATAYACWNDLLQKNGVASDDEIVFEFRNRWMEEKKRFTEEEIKRELSWMRSQSLVPDGTGPLTNPKPEKVPSGF